MNTGDHIKMNMENMTQHKIERLSWWNIQEYVHNLIPQLRPHRGDYTSIVGIGRGGLIPATILSHSLGFDRVHNFGFQTYTEMLGHDTRINECYQLPSTSDIGNNPLFIDDIVNTGKTWEFIKRKYPDVTLDNFASLLIGKDCKPEYCPAFYGFDVMEIRTEPIDKPVWVVFPWESQ